MLNTIINNMQTQTATLPSNLKSLIRARPQKKMQISVLIAPSIKDKFDAALKAGIKTTDLVNAALEAFLNKEVQ